MISPVRNGFTLIELLIVVVIMGVLASIALPLTELASKRAKEEELRTALRQIRTALDGYKKAADETALNALQMLQATRLTWLHWLKERLRSTNLTNAWCIFYAAYPEILLQIRARLQSTLGAYVATKAHPKPQNPVTMCLMCSPNLQASGSMALRIANGEADE